MQSYKIQKITETSMYPIENELRQLREENSANWFKLMGHLLSVVFSGFAVTLMCQQEYIPKLFNCIAEKFSWPSWLKYVLEVLFVLSILIVLVTVLFALVKYLTKAKDNKASEEDRTRLSEYFHKVIFNNITTGRSFLKKALECTDTNKELYFYESFYYFNLAYKEIKSKKIIEVGMRENYKLFLNEVGKNALIKTLIIYKESIYTLKANLQNPEKDIAKHIYEDIITWKINGKKIYDNFTAAKPSE